MPVIVLVLYVLVLVGAAGASTTVTQEDSMQMAEQAFVGIAHIYRSGGQAPDLVAKLNFALRLLQEAKFKRSQGDETTALRLEKEAKAAILEVIASTPDAQGKAELDSMITKVLVIGAIPLVVAISSFIFYCALRTWRWYEKTRLLEMRIVEKKDA